MRELSKAFDPRNDGGWLPPAGPPSRLRRIGGFLRRSLVITLCFALGVSLALGALVWQGRHELVGNRISLNAIGDPPASERAPEPSGLSQARTVLVVGDDSGDDLTGRFRDLGAGERTGHRTDTIMVLRIDPVGNEITGINFPRDLLVTLCDGSRQRINAAWYVDGPDCLIETVRDFAGVSIDHFVQVNFAGFVQIVDAVDGVPIYLEEPMEDQKAHLNLPAGCVTLNGRQALGFVRTRFDSDFGRIARQQRFLKELADRSTSLSVIANPVRLYQLVDSIGGVLTVDDGMSIGTMREFALTLRNVKSSDITMGTIPTYTDSSTGAYYEIPVEDQTDALLTAFSEGTLPEYLGEEPYEEASEPSESATPRPKPKIKARKLPPVSVLNASNIDQLATETAEVLRDAGLAIGTIGDSDRIEPADVVIAYPPGLLTEAQSLQVAAFPDAVLELDDTITNLTLILDSDVDPDSIEVIGGKKKDAGEASEPPTAPERPEYVNAEPDPTSGSC